MTSVVEGATGCPLAALRQDGAAVECGPVAVVRQGKRLHAFAATCPHGGASLLEAPVRRGVVTCTRHGARFRLADGKALGGPVKAPLAVYEVRAEDDRAVVGERLVPAAGLLARLRRALRLA